MGVRCCLAYPPQTELIRYGEYAIIMRISGNLVLDRAGFSFSEGCANGIAYGVKPDRLESCTLRKFEVGLHPCQK